MGKPPIRLPTYPGVERTAVLSYNTPASISGTAAGYARIGFYPQAALPLWIDSSSTNQSTFVAYSVPDTTVVSPYRNYEMTKLYSWGSGSMTGSATVPTVTGATGSLTGFPAVGKDSATGPLPWTNVPDGCSVTLIAGYGVSSGTTPYTVVVELESWWGPGEVNALTSSNIDITTNVQSGSVLLSSNTVGGLWIRPRSVNIQGSPLSTLFTLGLFITAGTPVVTHTSALRFGSIAVTAGTAKALYQPAIYPSDFEVSTAPWNDTRVTAGELRVLNVTSMLNRGGTVLGARLQQEDFNPVSGTRSVVTTWTSAQVASANALDKVYEAADAPLTGFHLPPAATSEFFDYSEAVAGTTSLPQSLPVFRLDDRRPYMALYYVLPAAFNLAMQLEWHLEFRSSRTLFPLGFSRISTETMSTAARLLVARNPLVGGDNTPPISRRPKRGKRTKTSAAADTVPQPKSKPLTQPSAQAVVKKVAKEKDMKPEGKQKPSKT